MHHLLEVILVLLVALVIGWIIGWFLRCVMFGRAGQQRGFSGDGRGKLGILEGRAMTGTTSAGSAMALASSAATTGAADAGNASTGDATRSETAASPAEAATETVEEQRQETGKADDSATGTTEDQPEEDQPEESKQAEEQAEQAEKAKGGEEAMPAHGLSAPVGGKADDLQLISGIGPKLEKLLHDLGIYHFAQIASWTEKDIAEVDDKLQFKGRIERDEWVRQAKLLADGKMEQFEKEYGTGGKKGADGKTRAGSRTRRK